MKIDLITGSTLYEATKNTLKKIDVNDINTDYFIVVPDRFTLKAEDLLFDTLNIEASFNLNVISLTGLAKEILGKENIETINTLEGIMIIQKIVEKFKDNLFVYKKSSPLFCYEILKNINQIKSCDIKPIDLNYTGNREVLRKKFADLSLIYSEYEKMMKDKKDSSDLIAECIDNIEEKDSLKDKVIIFTGFDSFTELNYQLIKSCVKSAKKIMISVTQPIGLNNSYIYDNDIFEKMKKISNEESVEIEVFSNANSLNDSQRKVAENLFGQKILGSKNDYLKITSSSSKYDEIEYYANLIKYKIFHEEKYKNFSIGCSDLSVYSSLIEKVFVRKGIPFYIDTSVNMKNSFLVKNILKIFDLRKKNFLKEDLLYLLKSELFEIEDRKNIIAFVNEREICGRKKYLYYLKDLLSQVDTYIGMLDTAQTYRDFVQIIRLIILDTNILFTKYIQKLEDNNMLKESNIESQVAEYIEKILQSLDKDEKCDLNNFVELFNIGIESVELSSLPAFCDAVFVGDVSNSYFAEVDNFIVLGANRGCLPIAMSDNGLLTDSDIIFSKLQKAINPTIKMINRRNRFKLFNNLTLAKKNLFVSFTTSDNDGKPTDKAMFVESLAQIFDKKEILNTKEISYFGNDKNFERFLFTLGGDRQSAELKLMEYLKEKDIPNEYLGSLQDVLKCDFEKLELNKKTVDKSLIEKSFSVSKIQDYYICPFKHFVDYNLRLKEKFSVKVDERKMGTFYHKLMEDFVRKFGKRLKDVSDEEIRFFVDKEISEIEEFKQLEFLADKEIIKKELYNDSKILCKRIVKEMSYSHFIPQKQEMKIFKEYSFDNKSIKLVGQIDRFDCLINKEKNQFRIIDYKTGKISKNMFTDLYYGKKIQLFIYSKALRENLGKSPLGVYYFNANPNDKDSEILEGVTLNEEGIREIDTRFNDKNFVKSDIIKAKRGKEKIDYNSVSEKELQELENYSLKICAKAIKNMFDGKIESSPIDGICKFCKYRAICLYNCDRGIRKSFEKKKDDLIKETEDE